MDLNYEQAELSLAILQQEERNWFLKLAELLGLIWTKEDLLAQVSDSKENESSEPPSKVMFPLSLLLRPEIWQTLKSVFGVESSEDGVNGMPHVPKDAISMSMLSKDEFIRRMGMQGQQQQKTSDLDLSSTHIPKESKGLTSGPLRRLGGK